MAVRGWPWNTASLIEWADRGEPARRRPLRERGRALRSTSRWGKADYIHAYLDTEKVTEDLRPPGGGWRRGCSRPTDHRLASPAVTIATAIFLIAIGAILRYAINVNTDVLDIPTVGLILMIAGGAGLALSLLYELVRSGDGRKKRDEIPPRSYSEDPTRRL